MSMLRALGFSGGVVRPVFARAVELPGDGNDDRLDVFETLFSFWAASTFLGPSEVDVTADGTTRSEPSLADCMAFCAATIASTPL